MSASPSSPLDPAACEDLAAAAGIIPAGGFAAVVDVPAAALSRLPGRHRVGLTLKTNGRSRPKPAGIDLGAFSDEPLEPAEIDLGIAAELRPQHAGMVTALEAGAHLAPALPVGVGEIAGILTTQPGGRTGEEPPRLKPDTPSNSTAMAWPEHGAIRRFASETASFPIIERSR